MELHVYLAFVVAAAIMIAFPGPSGLFAHSISFGWNVPVISALKKD